MKELKQLVRYVNPKRLRRLNFYKGGTGGADSQLKKLYQIISKAQASTDAEASKILFGDEEDARYPKLKYRLKEQLVNTSLLINRGNRKNDPYDFIFLDTNRKVYAAEMLRRSFLYSAAANLAKKALLQAEDAGLSYVATRCCDILISYHTFVKRNISKRSEYLEKARHWHLQYKADYDANLEYDYYIGFYINNTGFSEDFIAEITQSISALKMKYPYVDSLDFTYRLGFLEVILAMNRAQYDEVVNICKRQIESLERRNVYPRSYERNFLLQIISVSITTENIEDGARAVNKFLTIVPDGSRPWFRTQQLYTQLAITSKEYQLAVEIIDSLVEHKNFKALAEDVRERIILLKAYVYWLGSIGTTNIHNDYFKGFRLAKFLNSVPEFAKDRQGFHIPVLIVQALWLLHRKQYEKVRSRLTALRRYADRYLKNTRGTVRTYYFLKTFCQLADANFHRNGFLHRSEKNRKLLEEHPRSKVEQNAEVEIIPYERLYDLVVEQLDLRLH